MSFPFRHYRPGQREAIDAARHALTKDNKRFVILEAPTGSGKSAMAMTLLRETNDAYLLTAQKILQAQYVTDFPELALIQGRSNYPCEVNPLTTAAAAPCFLRHRDVRCDACQYFTAKEDALAANSVVTNYAYFLAEVNYSGGFGQRQLLVLDEAHNIEQALMNFVSVTLTEADLMRYGLEPPPTFRQDDASYFEYLEDLLPDLWYLHDESEKALKRVSDPASAVALDTMRRRSWYAGQSQAIERIVNSRNEDAVVWTINKHRTRQGGTTLTFKPVTIATFAEPLLFQYGKQILLLSATILDTATYLRSLGIDEDAACVVQVPSSFPAAHRPIVLEPTAKLTRHYLERDLPKLVATIGDLLDRHANEKGIIHTHSYKIAQAIYEGSSKKHQKRLITHATSTDRDDALSHHCQTDAPTVLLSPSMTEGLNLAGSLSQWQVICKIPYPYLGDPQIAARKALDPAWYDWLTTLSVVQAYGRSVRSEDDYAVTYLLDADFPKFINRQARRLPAWFCDAITSNSDTPDVQVTTVGTLKTPHNSFNRSTTKSAAKSPAKRTVKSARSKRRNATSTKRTH